LGGLELRGPVVALVISRSDRFAVGTVVKAFDAAGGLNRHHGGQQSGPVLAEATVDAGGKLTFSTLGLGLYELYAEAESRPTSLLSGLGVFSAPGTLPERVAARRALAGC
jgi:hypothetical protein